MLVGKIGVAVPGASTVPSAVGLGPKVADASGVESMGGVPIKSDVASGVGSGVTGSIVVSNVGVTTGERPASSVAVGVNSVSLPKVGVTSGVTSSTVSSGESVGKG